MPSPLNLITFDNVGSYDDTKQQTQSIFNGTKFYYRPVLPKDNNEAVKGISSTIASRHNTDIYDTSLSSIGKYLQDYPGMLIKPSEFAYLTDLGRFSNNRMIVARRFRDPVPHDLTSITSSFNAPLSTMISWVPPEEADFFQFNFGETYESVDAKFGGAFMEIFDKVEGESGAAALTGGITSTIQKGGGLLTGGNTGMLAGLLADVANAIGITDYDKENIPQGDPNLVQQAKHRALPDGGPSLKSDFEVKMTVRYEQKFINNIDPTIAFLDIIGNILRFGGSTSKFLLTPTGGDLVSDFFKKFKDGRWDQAIVIIVTAVINGVSKVVKNIVTALKKVVTETADAVTSGDAAGALDAVTKGLATAAKAIAAATISKYRIKIMGVIQAMTGMPSTPWHVTIGNPKSPFFSSGDMVTDQVEVKFGNVLAFNNLPSSIEAEFTLKPARVLGIQELFGRFNVGGGRSYEPIPTGSESILAPPTEEELNAGFTEAEKQQKQRDKTDKAAKQGAAKPDTNPVIDNKTTTIEKKAFDENNIGEIEKQPKDYIQGPQNN